MNFIAQKPIYIRIIGLKSFFLPEIYKENQFSLISRRVNRLLVINCRVFCKFSTGFNHRNRFQSKSKHFHDFHPISIHNLFKSKLTLTNIIDFNRNRNIFHDFHPISIHNLFKSKLSLTNIIDFNRNRNIFMIFIRFQSIIYSNLNSV